MRGPARGSVVAVVSAVGAVSGAWAGWALAHQVLLGDCGPGTYGPPCPAGTFLHTFGGFVLLILFPLAALGLAGFSAVPVVAQWCGAVAAGFVSGRSLQLGGAQVGFMAAFLGPVTLVDLGLVWLCWFVRRANEPGPARGGGSGGVGRVS